MMIANANCIETAREGEAGAGVGAGGGHNSWRGDAAREHPSRAFVLRGRQRTDPPPVAVRRGGVHPRIRRVFREVRDLPPAALAGGGRHDGNLSSKLQRFSFMNSF